MAESGSSHVDNLQTVEDDLYALLNLDKNASEQEITNAYRRLSKLYHPDKHTDLTKKQQAEILFNKTKRAYEILSDPHSRAIYDTVGIEGIRTDGWMIVQRTKTPQEIREEYEQLLKEREERKLQQQTNPKGTFVVGINATDIFEGYDEDFRSLSAIEVSSMSISQSVDAPLTTANTVSLSGNLSAQNGTGSGSIGCNIRRIISAKGWVEMGVGGGNGLVFTIKGFRHLANKSFGTLQSAFHFTPMGIVPTFQTVLGKQLTKEMAGYVTWNSGSNSSFKTTVACNFRTKHQLSSSLQLGIRNNFLSLNYSHKFSEETKFKCAFKLSTFGATAEYGCEKKLFQSNTVSAIMALGVPRGVTLKIKVTRANQSYLFPIHLSEEIIPSALFYGTVAPVLGWYILKVLFILPYEEAEKKKQHEENVAKLSERRKEALIAVSLMQESYLRIKEQEESRRGLIIVQAWYGNSIENQILPDSENIVDVTVQLQCLVKGSKLNLPARSKSNLPGFYDPCLDEEKYLLVNYLFRTKSYSITIKDDEVLSIPIDC